MPQRVMVRSRLETGGYSPSEAHYRLLARTWRSGGRLVLVGHAIGGTAASIGDAYTLFPPLVRLFERIANAGMVVITPDGGGTEQWMNATAVGALHAAVGWSATTFGTTSAVGLGVSMGNGALFRLQDDHGDLEAICGLIPLSDSDDVYDNDRGGNAASLDAAFAGDYTTNGAAFNPLVLAPGVTVPWQAWYGSADTTVIASTVEALAAAHAATTDLHEVDGGGHGNTTFDGIDPDTLIDFLASA